MAGVRDWAEKKLVQLEFQGDANALAAYVDALAENNAEHEDGNLNLLRDEASSELADFLGDAISKKFVVDLCNHLSKIRNNTTNVLPSAPPPTTAKEEPAEMEVTDSAPVAKREDLQRRPRKERSSRDIGRTERDARESRPRQAMERVPRHERDARPYERERRERGGMYHERELRERDSRERGAPREIERGMSRRGRGGGVDLRSTLSRRRQGGGPTLGGSIQKRPRDDSGGRYNMSKQQRVDLARSPPHGHSPSGNISPHMAAGVGPPHGVPPGVPPHGPHGAPPPGFPFGFPQMMMPNDPALFAQMMEAALSSRGGHRGMRGSRGARGGRGGRGRGRGGSIGNGIQETYSPSTLFVRNVPEEKLNFGDLNSYFSKFGTITNIRLMPAGKALLEFENRSSAQKAIGSVDAVFGNRHVKLNWARSTGTGGPNNDIMGEKESNNEEMTQVEDPETELKRKREEIKEAIRLENEMKEQGKLKKEMAIREQKSLIETLGKDVSMEKKKEGLKRLRELEAVIKEIDTPKQSVPLPPPKPAVDIGVPRWKRQRKNVEAYTLDNRPKNVQITGAKTDITVDHAAAIFRDTERAEMHQGNWILHFSTRAAAESALRAYKVLKRGFGTEAKARIIAEQQTPATPVENNNVPATTPQVAQITPQGQ